MNLFELAEQTERREAYPAPVLDECVPVFRGYMEAYHAAMLAGDTDAAIAARQNADDLCSYLHDEEYKRLDAEGASRYGRACRADWYKQLQQATAAPAGEVPMWGQQGTFVLTFAGVPVRIELDGMLCICSFSSLLAHFSVNVVEPRRPFLSETGYRSCFSGLRFAVPGMTLVEAITAYLTSYFKGEMRGKLVMLKHEHMDRALGVELDRSAYDSAGNREGSPEFAARVAAEEERKRKEARRWEREQARHAALRESSGDGSIYDDFDDDGRTRMGNTPDDVDEDDEDDEDGSEDVLYCDGCTVDLRQVDSYSETGCGTFCAGCLEEHVKDCQEEHGGYDDDDVDDLLPGMAHTQAERAAAAAEAEGASLTLDLLTPSPSITATTGQMEIYAPLFRGSAANPQLSLF